MATVGCNTWGDSAMSDANIERERNTDMVSFRLEPSVRRALGALASEAGFEVNSYMQRLLRLHAITWTDKDTANAHQILPTAERDLIFWSQWLIDAAVRTAREMDAAGEFTAHFTLAVIRALFQDPEFVANYAKVEGSEARESGVSAKSALNMALGFHIKSAVGAEAETDGAPPKGKPKRVQVRGEAIQSYTLLRKPYS